MGPSRKAGRETVRIKGSGRMAVGIFFQIRQMGPVLPKYRS